MADQQASVDNNHVFAQVIVNGQEMNPEAMETTTSPPEPPPPPPIPTLKRSPTFGSESSPVEEHKPSVVRFNSQPEYFPEYESLQGSHNWSAGRGLSDQRSPPRSSPPPVRRSPPPPPEMSPPPVPKKEILLDAAQTTEARDQVGDAIYSTVDRNKKRNSQQFITTIQTDNALPQKNPALEHLLAPTNFSPHHIRNTPGHFAFQGDNSTPMLSNGVPMVNIHTATALVDNLENSLNSVNYGLFEKPPTTRGDYITMVKFTVTDKNDTASSHHHHHHHQALYTSSPNDFHTYPTYATIPPRQSAAVTTTDVNSASLDRSNSSKHTPHNPLYVDDESHYAGALLSPAQLQAAGGQVYTSGHEYWTRIGDNVTVVSLEGGRNKGVRSSTRSLQYERGKLTRQDSVRSVDRVVRNGNAKPQNGSVVTVTSPQQQQQQPQQQQQQQQQSAPPTEDFAAAAHDYEKQMQEKIAEQNRKRCCRATIFVCLIVVLVCLAVGLGIYFTEQNAEEGEA